MEAAYFSLMENRNLGSHEDSGRNLVLVKSGMFYREEGSLWGGCD